LKLQAIQINYLANTRGLQQPAQACYVQRAEASPAAIRLRHIGEDWHKLNRHVQALKVPNFLELAV
jgi:hypothetical protein